MASILKIKRTNVASRVPVFGTDIGEGELALNLKDQKIYSANSSAVFQLDQQVPAGTVVKTTSTVSALSEDSVVVTNVESWANSVVDLAQLSALRSEFEAYVSNTNSYIAATAATGQLNLSNTNNRFAILADTASGSETIDGGSFS